jgi:hypothetical protein
MTEKRLKRPRDFNQFAKQMVDLATGNAEEKSETGLTKRARAGGSKGGPARSAALTPEQRSEIARAAAAARWKKTR